MVAIEIFVAKNFGKEVILLTKDAVPAPWVLNFSDHIVTSEAELIMLLHELEESHLAT